MNHNKRLAEVLGLPLRVLEAGIATVEAEIAAAEAKEVLDAAPATDAETEEESPNHDETPVQAGEVTNDQL